MAANDSWMYEGRQQQMWFGHGTKPDHGKSLAVPSAVLPPLQERIHNVGYTLVAGFPATKRHHAVARLRGADHDRLDRVLTGVVHALPLWPRVVPLRVLGTCADAPGIASFVKAAGVIRDADSHAELRAATDLIAHSAQEMGLDRFQPFLRRADDHLTRTGGLLTLVRDLPPLSAPPVARVPVPVPTGPRLPPIGRLITSIGRLLEGAGFYVLAWSVLDAVGRSNREAHIRAAVERFGLDPSKPADMAAAVAYAWAEVNRSLLMGTALPESAQDAVAEQVMRAVRADPSLLDRAMAGDAGALATIRAAVKATPGPTSDVVHEGRTDEERALIAQLVSEGKTGAEIKAALDYLRADRDGATATQGISETRPPLIRQIPPEQLRFSQRSAGANGGTEFHRRFVRENGRIVGPVDAVRTPDGIVTIDNTRVAIAREQGLTTVPVRVWEPSDPIPADMARRFRRARTWGEALKRRLERQRPPIPPTGTTEFPDLR